MNPIPCHAFNRCRIADRKVLLAGVSVIALLTGTLAPADAGSLRDRSVNPAAAATSATTAAAQAAASAASQALTRVNNSLRAMRDTQAAARAAALAVPTTVPTLVWTGLPTVTDGLSPGGLVVDPRVASNPNLWINGELPTQTTTNGVTDVTVRQTAKYGVYTWQQFNVGKNTTLTFDQQGNASWVALNRISATGVPSQILGNIKADGTVLVINPNGIIFGAGSQVNVGSLIATTNDIATSAAASPFALNPDGAAIAIQYEQPAGQNFLAPPREDSANQYFAENGLFTVPGKVNVVVDGQVREKIENWSAAFALGAATPATPGGGIIDVQRGATISASAGASGAGGYVALLAPTVVNAGLISTPAGSIVLATAGKAVLSVPMAPRWIGDLVGPPAESGTRAGSMLVFTPAATEADRVTVGGAPVDILPVDWSPLHSPPFETPPFGNLVRNDGLLLTGGGTITLSAGTVGETGSRLALDPLTQGIGLVSGRRNADGSFAVDIVQTQQKAILNWSSFKIDTTDLHFDQTAGKTDVANWIAFNRVLDPTTAPTRIRRTIVADGGIYLVNRNGIEFTGTSQTRVGSLVASSLSLSDAQFLAGINSGQLTGLIGGGSETDLLPTFGDVPQTTDVNAPAPVAAGNVEVQAGAQITSGKYGLIGLFGTNVTNSGTLTTNGGQVLLAAGEQVTIVPHSADSGMIGVRAYVSALPRYYTGAIFDPAYFQTLIDRTAQVGMVVTNNGQITAEAGNITVVGSTVRQNGIMRAVTTLDSPGTIMVAAEDSLRTNKYGGIKRRGGTVVFGEDSITQIVVDPSGVVGTGGSAGNSSVLRISGQTVELKGKTGAGADELQGAYVQAQAGKIDIDLRGTEDNFNNNVSEGFGSPQAPAAGTRLLMQAGSILDVSGVRDAEVAMETNSVEVEVRANEVRDSPLQRGGILQGKKVWVDRRLSGKRTDGSTWKGTAVVDANDYIANVPTSMEERAVTGGAVTIHAAEAVVMTGAEINISGGSTRYLDGYIRTTTLIGIDGRRYNIGNAPADMVYAALGGGFTRTHERWEVTEVWTSPLRRSSDRRFERGYVEGAAGGALEIYANAQVLDGVIVAQAITGDRQVSAPPAGGALKIGAISPPDTNFNANNLLLQAQAASLPDDFTMSSALPTARASTLVLSTDMLNDSGLTNVEIYTDGSKKIAADVDLHLQPGASFKVYGDLAGKSITVDGSIRIAGGSVSITGKGPVTVNGIIDVSGQWTNEINSPRASNKARNGGTIELGTQGAGERLVFKSGAVLAADAGATLGSNRKATAGNAGSITLSSGLPMDLRPVTMSAYGVAISDQVATAPAGGLLQIVNAPAVSIVAGGGAPAGNLITLDPSFFDRGGFSQFAFNLASITDGVTLAPKVQTRVLAAGYSSRVSADRIAAVSTPMTLSDNQRRGVTLNMKTVSDFTLGANSVIAAGFGGQVNFNGGTNNITIAGMIDAPAGSINIAGNNVTLASTAQLLARGAARIVTDARGLRSGSVLGGGTVGLSAQNEVITQAGSLIDVSGTSGVIDIPNGGSEFDRGYRPLTLDSNGGSISISGSRGLVEGTLIARAGGPGAVGGSISFAMQQSLEMSPRTQLEILLGTLNPSCYGYASGTCDFADWQQSVGFDFQQMFIDFGFFDYLGSTPEPIVFSQALVDALSATATGNIILSRTATGDGGGVNPDAYGLNTQLVQYLSIITSELIDGSDFSQVFRSLSPLVVRPASFQSGGFAGLAVNGANLELDGVNIALSQSIQVGGSLINRNGTSSRLAAPMIVIGGFDTATAATALAGQLTLAASRVDITQAGIRGYAQTTIETTDLRMSGDYGNASRLDVDGALVIAAGQIYPTTQTSATITAGQSITILPHGAAPPPPLSAGGSLTLSAPIIDQRGTLRAPFGEIVLDASDTLTLAAGSITSVSGAGLTVPYGYLVEQVLWHAGNPTSPLTSPPEKRITLKAPTVDMKSGAVVDLSGGGDLLAYQFIPGSGGSSDYLTYGNAVAILPVSMVSTVVGEQVIHLAGGNGIAAGDYVVMPASYALLPGAYRLEVVAGTTDYTGSARLADGSVIVAGYNVVAGTDSRDQRTQAYKVAGIDTIRLWSEYKIWTANEYFASTDFVEAMRRQSGLEVTAIPRLPMDAGTLQIAATLSATLDATLLGSAVDGGRGAAVDISADKVAVVGGVDASAYQAAGYLVLDAAALSALGGESLLIGGTRRQTASGLEVDAVASSIVIATNGTAATALVAPEILLASEDTLIIADGSLIEARRVVGGGSGNVLIVPAIAAVKDASGVITSPSRDYGAFVRVSNGETVSVVRENVQPTQGTLTVGAAILKGKTILLDATKTTTVSGNAALDADVLDVASGRISIGTPTGTPDGLVLSSASLAGLAGAADLRLRSYTSIDFYGAVNLGTRNADGSFALKTLRLDAAALNSAPAATVDIAASEVVFTNTVGGTATSLGGSGGTLAIAADTVSLGSGAKAVDGFGRVQIAAQTAIVGRGAGTIDFRAADLAFSAPLLTVESGAAQDWTTAGAFSLAGMPAGGGMETLGGRLAITAASISQGGLIDLTAGSLTLRATTGDVVLAAGSTTRAAGFTRVFYDQRADIAGGIVNLVADQGQVWAQAGSLIDVSASGSGSAGTLAIATPLHEARLDGDMRAVGGGNFSLDASAVGAFGSLSAKLRQSGFDGDLTFRLRGGDVVLDGEARARSFTLATDAGSVTVTGTVDVSGAAGGTIRLAAKQDLTVATGAILRANAGSAKENSGVIELAAADGSMDLRAGATIEAVGGRNGNGEIRLRFKRDDGNGSVKLVNAAATMTAGKIIAEAYRSYPTTSVDADLPGALADAAGFMSTYAAGIEAALGRGADPTFHLVPGIELASSGDLTLSAATDLSGARYNGEAGVLTLRAAGNLVLNGSLSDGFDSAASTAAVLTDTASWSYRLVGGADLSAADPLAVRPLATFAGGASDNVGLGTGVMVRTGTGSISLAAGNDVVLADKSSVIYTAGARIADPSLGGTYTGNDYNPVFTQGGGDVRVTAQNDIKAITASDQMIVDWLWRSGDSNSTDGASGDNSGSYKQNQQTAWWINFSAFQQGVAALGGGDVTLDAGRDIVNVSASTPTQGRVGGGRTATEAKTVVITGGGDLTVKAGRDIVGGVYYVDGGSGVITAGGAITSNRSVVFSDTDPAIPDYNVRIRTVLALGDADLKVTAGGNIDLHTVGNPTLWTQSQDQVGSTGNRSYFSTYGDNTALSLLSRGGDVTLWNTPIHLLAASQAWRGAYASDNYATWEDVARSLVYYPSNITAVAAAGDITIHGGMVMYPSATGNLDLWAQNSVNLRLIDQTGGWVDGAIFRTLVMSPTEPDLLRTILRPRFVLANMNVITSVLHEGDSEPSRIYANDGDITEGYGGTGSVAGRGQTYSEQVWFRAGRDINNLRLRAQNSSASDLTLVQAGRDINLNEGRISIDGPGFVLAEAGRDVFLGRGGGIETNGNGETPSNTPGTPPTYTNPFLPRQGADLLVLAGTADDPRYDAFVASYFDFARIPAYTLFDIAGTKKLIYLYTVDGLSAFMRQATGDATIDDARAAAILKGSTSSVDPSGRSLYLNGLDGFDKIGNFVRAATNNPNLTDASALAYLRATKHMEYNGQSVYLYDIDGGNGLMSFMQRFTGGRPTEADALNLFPLLRQDYQKFFIDRVLSAELKAAGRGQYDGLGAQGLGYERGYKAIATLFPGAEQAGNTAWQGDIIMERSMIRTYRGGDLDIVAPGGMLQVSALSSNATGDHDGVLTINGGEIRITTGLGTIINKSRVLTARGGDITIWSTFGDIDAGKGRKSSLSTPPTTYLLSLDGNISYRVNPNFSGSGISTQKGSPDAALSDVDLYAPNGIINAGDAGISSSNAIYLGALEIRGAENITAAGEVKGLPKKTESVATLAVETKDKAASDAVTDATRQAPSERPSVIIVEILGYGGADGSAPSQPQPQERNDRDKESYDPRSSFRVLGDGDLTEAQKRLLTAEERSRL